MQAYRIETTIAQNGTLLIQGVPFRAGDKVEVIILPSRSQEKQEPQNRYPLRGKVIRYEAPFDSVAENDWDTLR
ncbi:MAG: hypothetical protein EXR62_16140 [Chloroflexi bacterium]|nr:hypothetical protein [Chloroflexota bacterium]